MLASTDWSPPAVPVAQATTASPTPLTATTGTPPMPTSSGAPHRGAAAGRPAAWSTRVPPGRRTLHDTRAEPDPPRAAPAEAPSASDISTGRSKAPATVRDVSTRPSSTQAASAPRPGLRASEGGSGPGVERRAPRTDHSLPVASAVARRTWNPSPSRSIHAAVALPRRSSATARSCTGATASATRPGLQDPAGPCRTAATIRRPLRQTAAASPRAFSATRVSEAPGPDIVRALPQPRPAGRAAICTRPAAEEAPAGVRTQAASAAPPGPAAIDADP